MKKELTAEEKKKRHEKLVRNRPCKSCIWYRPDNAIKCGHDCDYDHSGFHKMRNPII